MAQSLLLTWGFPEFTKRELALGLAAILLIVIANRILYAVHLSFFHPLAQFPGPPKAARSRRYIFRITDSEFPEEILESIHENYQTKALRIGPNELHITDVHQYKVIYSQTQPFPKDKGFYDALNTPHTVVTETDVELHKERRRLLNPSFSRAEAFKLEPIIHEKIGILIEQINKLKDSQDINIYNAFRCLTSEITMEFVFAKPASLLQESNTTFGSWFLDAFDTAAESFWLMQELPWLWKIANYLPLSFVTIVKPEAASMFRLLQYAETCLLHYEKNGNTTSHPVLFDGLSTLPHKTKVGEALVILIAGADTTASTLTTGLLHILSNPLICDKLTRELCEEDSSFQLLKLEKLEYLGACVKESLRIGMAVPGRLPRIVPQNLSQPLIVDGKVIPPGTIVSMSAYTMHTSEEIWGPDARVFNPDRWLTPAAKSLEQYLCTFSKGARMCLGQNIALAELTIITAYMFRSFKMSLLPDFQSPKRKDLFTMGYPAPGLPVKFTDISNKETDKR